MNNELWIDIYGYEGYYQISNLGSVKSLERTIIRKNNSTYHQKEKIMKLTINKNGYYYVTLNGKNKVKTFLVHRLVAQAFIPNVNNFPEINHKDENKLNNCVDNLEWCTNLYNENYGTSNERAGKLHRKEIIQYSDDNDYIHKYSSGIEAERITKIDNGSISKCCYGKMAQAGGYKWRFANE